ncbi:MAG: cellulase family glycosylhydrolase [Chitinispirillaceae bacterium]|nr:cellulase family glycosylhydrolase [Chitinispirillaceae bacterium]
MERLRGLNFGGWLSQIDAIAEKDPKRFPGVDAHMEQWIGRDDFFRQKQWGFNHVRLPIDAFHFFADNDSPVESRLQFVDRATAWAAEADLRLILDLHKCPGHDFAEAADVPVQKLFSDPTFLKKAEKIWANLAERYSGYPHILFEVLNEPVAPDAAAWNRVKDALCLTIRQHAPRNWIVVGSNMWNWPSTYRELVPVEDDAVVYNFHFYEPLLFTHQNAPWIHEPEIRATRTYPADFGEGLVLKYGFIHSAGVWNRDRFIEELEPVVRFGQTNGAPVICNEFGVYAPVPLELQLTWLDDLLSVLRERGIGFTYWNYKNLDFGIISCGEALHENLPQYDNPERISYGVLKALRRY